MKNDKRKVSENKAELFVGWLSPHGEFYSLDGYICHEELAQEILGNKRDIDKYVLAREELIDKGWVIIQDKNIYSPKPTYYFEHMLTEYQATFLEQLIESKEIVREYTC